MAVDLAKVQVKRDADLRATLSNDGGVKRALARLEERSSGYGFGLSLSYGDGVYGGGFYGQCVEVKNHETQGLFVAGDYSVRLKAIDGLGNEGDWSDPFTIAHRPDPPAPTNPTVTSNVLAFDWSDP